MKILIIDTYYPDFLKTVPINPAGTYESELRAVLNQSFGTSDFYSRNLQAYGWETMDVIANHHQLQRLWASGAQRDLARPLACQAEDFNPDVVFFQDTSLIDWLFHKPPIVAAQVSCPWPGNEKIRQCDVVFTSFPHYVHRIEALGVRAVYNPLAFDPIVLHRIAEYPDGEMERDFDCIFVGGVGAPSHWRNGLETLEAVARAIPTFKWWGYGVNTLNNNSPLRDKYQGEAWGLDMYRLFLRAKIVLNRHGEVAQGYSNNMRMFEATGCGALLLTEESPNLHDYFSDIECLSYTTPRNAVEQIGWALNNRNLASSIARMGQARTLRDHTYAQRMKTISDALIGMLNPVAQ